MLCMWHVCPSEWLQHTAYHLLSGTNVCGCCMVHHPGWYFLFLMISHISPNTQLCFYKECSLHMFINTSLSAIRKPMTALFVTHFSIRHHFDNWLHSSIWQALYYWRWQSSKLMCTKFKFFPLLLVKMKDVITVPQWHMCHFVSSLNYVQFLQNVWNLHEQTTACLLLIFNSGTFYCTCYSGN